MEKKSSKVLVTLGPGGWGPAAGGDGLRSKTPCPRCYFAISPLSASRDVETNVWTKLAEHRAALRPFYSFSHFLAMQDEAQHSSLALGVCPTALGNVCIALSGRIPRYFAQCLADATLLDAHSNRKRDPAFSGSHPGGASWRGRIPCRIGSAFGQEHAVLFPSSVVPPFSEYARASSSHRQLSTAVLASSRCTTDRCASSRPK